MTPKTNRRRVLAAIAAGAGWIAAGAAAAIDSRGSVRLIVGAAPGGAGDFMARTFADAMGSPLGMAMVVDNKPGASGTLAADVFARTAPDGQTLFVSGPSPIIMAPHLLPKLRYDPAQFVPIAMLGAGAFALVVHPSLPANTVQELVALARSRPGQLSFGSGGNGTSGHLCTESFCAATGTKMLHVPYKGDGQAVNDLLAGEIQVMFTAPNVALPLVKGGRLRLLGVTTRERIANLPDVPTIGEAGVKDFEYLGWIIAFAPAGTPRRTVDALVTAWKKARTTPDVRRRLDELAMAAPERLLCGEPLARFIRAEDVRTAKLVRQLGIKMD